MSIRTQGSTRATAVIDLRCVVSRLNQTAPYERTNPNSTADAPCYYNVIFYYYYYTGLETCRYNWQSPMVFGFNYTPARDGTGAGTRSVFPGIYQLVETRELIPIVHFIPAGRVVYKVPGSKV